MKTWSLNALNKWVRTFQPGWFKATRTSDAAREAREDELGAQRVDGAFLDDVRGLTAEQKADRNALKGLRGGVQGKRGAKRVRLPWQSDDPGKPEPAEYPAPAKRRAQRKDR